MWSRRATPSFYNAIRNARIPKSPVWMTFGTFGAISSMALVNAYNLSLSTSLCEEDVEDSSITLFDQVVECEPSWILHFPSVQRLSFLWNKYRSTEFYKKDQRKHMSPEFTKLVNFNKAHTKNMIGFYAEYAAGIRLEPKSNFTPQELDKEMKKKNLGSDTLVSGDYLWTFKSEEPDISSEQVVENARKLLENSKFERSKNSLIGGEVYNEKSELLAQGEAYLKDASSLAISTKLMLNCRGIHLDVPKKVFANSDMFIAVPWSVMYNRLGELLRLQYRDAPWYHFGKWCPPGLVVSACGFGTHAYATFSKGNFRLKEFIETLAEKASTKEGVTGPIDGIEDIPVVVVVDLAHTLVARSVVGAFRWFNYATEAGISIKKHREHGTTVYDFDFSDGSKFYVGIKSNWLWGGNQLLVSVSKDAMQEVIEDTYNSRGNLETRNTEVPLLKVSTSLMSLLNEDLDVGNSAGGIIKEALNEVGMNVPTSLGVFGQARGGILDVRAEFNDIILPEWGESYINVQEE